MQVILRLKRNIELTEDLIVNLRRPFRGLANMGQWGGMAGDMYEPHQSTITLVNDGALLGSNEIQWGFDTTQVHPGTAFVIQNIGHFLHLNLTPIEALVIRSPLLRDGLSVKEELPYDYEPYPFTVNYEIESGQVVIDVDFRDRQPPNAAEPFHQAWDGWYEVAAHGGFCSEDFLPEEVKIFIEDELRVTSTGIGGVFDDVVIDDAGFYCFINMLQVLHHRFIPIAEVTIE